MKIKHEISYFLDENGRQAIKYDYQTYLLQIRTYKTTEDLIIENVKIPKDTLFVEDADTYWIRTNVKKGSFKDHHLIEFFKDNKIVFVSEENFFDTNEYKRLIENSKFHIKDSLKEANDYLKTYFERKKLLKELKNLKKENDNLKVK